VIISPRHIAMHLGSVDVSGFVMVLGWSRYSIIHLMLRSNWDWIATDRYRFSQQ
jgi:hypothetical protein